MKSPQSLGSRVTLASGKPVYLLVIAKRTAALPVFPETPQQSDYLVAWGQGQNKKSQEKAAKKLGLS